MYHINTSSHCSECDSVSDMIDSDVDCVSEVESESDEVVKIESEARDLWLVIVNVICNGGGFLWACSYLVVEMLFF